MVSVFGKVTLVNRTYNSITFTESAKLIEDAYNSRVISSVTVLDNENSTAGFEIVHYEIKVSDDSYREVLSASNLSDPAFNESFLNVDGKLVKIDLRSANNDY